jgi:hypothetical protein
MGVRLRATNQSVRKLGTHNFLFRKGPMGFWQAAINSEARQSHQVGYYSNLT